MKHVTHEQQYKRLKKFKGTKDNSTVSYHALSEEEHKNCFETIKTLKQYPIQSEEAKEIIDTVEEQFIFKFEYNRPVYWHFNQWSKTSYLSDDFSSFLLALEVDYTLINEERINYSSLYGVIRL